MTLSPPILPDVLEPGLRVVFCGTAPGTASARAGAYAGPGNRFWATLHEVGLTPVLLAPAEFAHLPEFGIGLTDVSKTASGSDLEVGRRGFDHDFLQQLERSKNAWQQISPDDRAEGRAGFQRFPCFRLGGH